MEYIKSRVRDVYDFPAKGVVFKDLTTVFKDPRALHIIGWDLSQLYRDKGVTKVVGIESRGFIGGSILAFELGAGFVPARKPGKLPADTIRMEYAKEYGTDVIEIHRDAIGPDDIVVPPLVLFGSLLFPRRQQRGYAEGRCKRRYAGNFYKNLDYHSCPAGKQGVCGGSNAEFVEAAADSNSR